MSRFLLQTAHRWWTQARRVEAHVGRGAVAHQRALVRFAIDRHHAARRQHTGRQRLRRWLHRFVIALRKADTALLDKLNAAIAAVRANGTYKKIQDQYFDFDVYGK